MSHSSRSTTDEFAVSAPAGRRPVRRLAVASLATLALLVPMLSLVSAPASADTAPQPPVTTPTVSADALPTVQINGVVWDQTIVGNTVYVTGEFTSARPAGSAAGTNETPRSNILAYNLTTGALITTWAPTLNAQGKSIKASADGSIIYVGGSFTSVSGVARNRLVALNASTGAVITTFNPNSSSRVNAIAISGNLLYAGGIFTTMGGQPRTRLAAVSTLNGAVQPWAPSADAEVSAMTAPPGSNEVVVGGHFTSLSGTNAQGLGAIRTTDGATLPFAINSIIQNGGADAGITSLSSDSARVYGTGYTFGPGNFEGTFAAEVNGGAEVFITGCRGDTYDAVPIGGVLYSASHSHDCSSIGGNPQTDPWTFQHAWASSTGQGAGGAVNQGGTFAGQPAPELLHWLPTFTNGKYTGATQAAWTIEGNSQYVIAGGEFPSVNGTAQQGLVRFAVSSIATNKQGPNSTVNPNAMVPTLVSLAPGRVRVSWPAAWDRDNRNLTYEVLRGATLGSSVVIGTQTADSSWFNRPQLFFQDTSAPAGSTQTYRIRAKDAFANTLIGNTASIQVPAGNGTTSTYANTVLADGATHLWRLGEASGTNAYDYAAADDLTLDSSATRGADGAMVDDATAKSTTFPGTATVPAVTPALSVGPNTFTAEGWFKTTTTSGGKIIGFGNSNTGDSNNYDRQVYMTNGGQILFGVYNNGTQTIGSATAYNDGQWHQFTASLSSGGMELFLDGRRVARNSGVTSGQPFSGYWRIGGDNLGSWPSQPNSNKFSGSIEDVAIYGAPLSLAQVQSHYQASGRTLNLPTRPTDAYGAAVWDAEPSVFWRLDDSTGSTTALNRMTNQPSGSYSAGVVKGGEGAPANASGTSVSFPGDGTQALVSDTSVNNPTTYSLETWFKTTSTDGGRLIGFGRSGDPNSTSSSYDRHIWIQNDGTLRYGIYTGATVTVASPTALNDGVWHQAVATQSSSGMKLYVDGALVGSDPANTPENYPGFWRLGSDHIWFGANTENFQGSLDETAIYDTELPAATVSQHYQLGKPVAANQAPTAAFTSTKVNLKASFDASTSADTDGTIASYAWTFGDGTTGTGISPDHTYATPGTYTVGLTVTDDDGATGTVTNPVTVTQPANVLPTAAFTSSTSKLKATFDGSTSSDSDGTIASYAWDFGDGTSGTGDKPVHTYAGTGSYTVALTVTDDRGGTSTVTHVVTVTANAAPAAAFSSACTNLSCTFDGSGSSDTDGTIAGYAWNFGDGGTSTVAKPSHTFTSGSHDVTLTVTDNDGATNATTQTVVVSPANNPPTAGFTSTPTGLAVAFTSTSTDADGTVASYAWDFGDNGTSTVANPTHTYATAGDYTVSLTVTDDKGATGTTSKTVTVVAPNQKPTASFTATTTGLSSAFNAAASSDPDGSIVSYAWNFGDGTTGTGSSTSHTYTAGTYTVTLTVTDDDGATDTATRSVSPAATPNTAPTAAFTSTTSGLTATFDATGSTDPDGTITAYAWNFGDNLTGSGATPSHPYAAAGTYTVVLTVTDDDGATKTATHTVTVTAPPANTPPVASWTSSCTDLACNLNGSASSDADGTIASYAWAFGDSSSGTGATVSHTYAAAGTYNVTLTVTDDKGATNQLTRAVTVTAPSATLATDAFGRTVTTNWGTADTGGAWTNTGSKTSASVADGTGRVSIPAGYTAYERLNAVQNLSTDVTHTVWLESVPTGGGAYLGTIVRGTAAGDYNAQMKVLATGSVVLSLQRAGTTLGTAVTVPGLTYTAGKKLSLRVQAVGSAPTTLRARVWVTGTTEPSTWTVTATDSTAGFQVAGSVGVFPYLSGSATAPVVVRYDDVKVSSSN